ncbi:MAG: M15 family metallopeptidase [Oscillibacter sp.]
MLNSRDIGLLRFDVAANCRTMIALCAAAGLPVLVTGTVRDEEYQMVCYNNGTSKGKIPTFHSKQAGLAFDICKNVKGGEYSDMAFWAGAAAIGKKMGFTWGGDWKSFPDQPHFQWDDGGKFTNKLILAKKYPPAMPLYPMEAKEEIEVRYAYLKDIPGGEARNIVGQLMTAGIVNGDGSDPLGNGDKIDLSVDQVRNLMFSYRGGAFDRKLLACGMKPAVQ